MKKIEQLSTTDSPNKGLSKFTIDDFRSFFYLMNAAPDRETRIYNEDKIVSMADIIELNSSINEKLKNHDPETYKVNTIVTFDNNRALTYEFWNKFEEEKWQTTAVTKNIIITWDFALKLTGYELPQRHIVKLRIGSKMNAKEVLELVMSHEGDHQIAEAFAHSICSVDFINPIIGSEIFLIVENWHKCLPKNLFFSKWHETISKHSVKIKKVILFLVLLTSGTILFGLFKVYINKIWTINIDQLFYSRIFLWMVFSTIFFLFSYEIGKWWSFKIENYIDRIKPSTLFKFTKGDENANLENQTKNNKLIKDIGIKILVTIIVSILSLVSIFLGNKIYDLFVN